MKKIFAIAVAAALLVGVTALAYGAPAEKATGGVESARTELNWSFSFNAHEGPDADGTDGKGQLVCTSSAAARVLKCVVAYVNVDPGSHKALFAAKCTKDSGPTVTSPTRDLTGEWIVVEVLDGGTPGRKGDKLGWQWYPAETSASGLVEAGPPALPLYDITKGNLVVH